MEQRLILSAIFDKLGHAFVKIKIILYPSNLVLGNWLSDYSLPSNLICSTVEPQSYGPHSYELFS